MNVLPIVMYIVIMHTDFQHEFIFTINHHSLVHIHLLFQFSHPTKTMKINVLLEDKLILIFLRCYLFLSLCFFSLLFILLFKLSSVKTWCFIKHFFFCSFFSCFMICSTGNLLLKKSYAIYNAAKFVFSFYIKKKTWILFVQAQFYIKELKFIYLRQ